MPWRLWLSRSRSGLAARSPRLAMGRTKLYELIGSGRLATTTVGRRRLVLVRSLRTLLEANISKGTQA
jgi:hypothetical protein